MLLDYFYVFCFMIISTAFVVGACVLPLILAPRSRGAATRETYESGEFSLGTVWIPYHIAYYLFALIFLAFDVEAIFLFPAAMAYKPFLGLKELVEVILFVGILGFALFYAWKKGVFTWR